MFLSIKYILINLINKQLSVDSKHKEKYQMHFKPIGHNIFFKKCNQYEVGPYVHLHSSCEFSLDYYLYG